MSAPPDPLTLDFAGMRALALGRMGLAPQQFWGLTPFEFMMLSGAQAGLSRGFSRADLDALMARFPDVADGAILTEGVSR